MPRATRVHVQITAVGYGGLAAPTDMHRQLQSDGTGIQLSLLCVMITQRYLLVSLVTITASCRVMAHAY